MKILVIDNYDSFVFNLVHILHNIGDLHIDVVKNDKIDIENVDTYDKILLSPGPGIPKDAGLIPALINRYKNSKSILGICLGHQAIAESFSSALVNLENPLHGIASEINVVADDYLFENIPKQFVVGHYHSWVVDTTPNPDLEVLAYDNSGNIMALKHKYHDLRGLQFHPESILTENGIAMITNWVNHPIL